MTNKKDLKALIRERMSKTGERYSTARVHVLAPAKRQLSAAEGTPRCPACAGALSKRTVMVMPDFDDIDEDSTEGQIADFFAAEASGDFGEWAVEETVLFCPQCEPPRAASPRRSPPTYGFTDDDDFDDVDVDGDDLSIQDD